VKARTVKGAAIRLATVICLLASTLCIGSGIVLSQSKEKKSAQKLYNEAKKAIRSGHYEKARKIYHELLEQGEKDLQALLGLSLAWLKDQSYQNCYDRANEALEIDPENARAHALVGMSLLRSGYIYNSIQSLYRAFKSDPKEPLAYGTAA
jgi:tetratricopeptide (TPR) repeat protein